MIYNTSIAFHKNHVRSKIVHVNIFFSIKTVCQWFYLQKKKNVYVIYYLVFDLSVMVKQYFGLRFITNATNVDTF